MRARFGLAVVAVPVPATPAPAKNAPFVAVAGEGPSFSREPTPERGGAVSDTRGVLRRAGVDGAGAIRTRARIMRGAKGGAFDVIARLHFDEYAAGAVACRAPFIARDIRLARRIGADRRHRDAGSLRTAAIAERVHLEDASGRVEDRNKAVVRTTRQAVRGLVAGRAVVMSAGRRAVDHALRNAPSLTDGLGVFSAPRTPRPVPVTASRQRPDRAAVVAAFAAGRAKVRADGSLAALIFSHGLD